PCTIQREQSKPGHRDPSAIRPSTEQVRQAAGHGGAPWLDANAVDRGCLRRAPTAARVVAPLLASPRKVGGGPQAGSRGDRGLVHGHGVNAIPEAEPRILPVWLNLSELIRVLRTEGFSVGLDEDLKARALLVQLAFEGIYLDDPREAARWLGPVFCSNPKEQYLF